MIVTIKAKSCQVEESPKYWEAKNHVTHINPSNLYWSSDQSRWTVRTSHKRSRCHHHPLWRRKCSLNCHWRISKLNRDSISAAIACWLLM